MSESRADDRTGQRSERPGDRPEERAHGRVDERVEERAEERRPEERRPEERVEERPAEEERPERRPSTPFTQQLGRLVVAVILVLFGVFAVFNAQAVTFDWIWGEGEVSLILLLLGSFLLGGIAGWFATWRSHRRS